MTDERSNPELEDASLTGIVVGVRGSLSPPGTSRAGSDVLDTGGDRLRK